MMQFKGGKWELFGDIIISAETGAEIAGRSVVMAGLVPAIHVFLTASL